MVEIENLYRRLFYSRSTPITFGSCLPTWPSTPMVSLDLRRRIPLWASDRPLSLPVTEQTPSLSYGIAGSSQTEHNCPICGKPVDRELGEAQPIVPPTAVGW